MISYGTCSVCGNLGEVILTIYGQTRRHVLRCPKCLNQPEDRRANPHTEETEA